MSPPVQSQNLLERAVSGDAVALTLLLKNIRQQVSSRLSRRIPADLRSTVDADDILQATFVEVYRRIADFDDRGPNAFDRWVATIAMSRLRDAIKSHRRAKRGGGRMPLSPAANNIEDSIVNLFDVLAGSSHTPSRSFARREVVAAVRQALDQLPEDNHRAIWMVHIEGRPVAEAAREMNRTERAIHGLTRRGMKKLRELIGPQSAFFSSAG